MRRVATPVVSGEALVTALPSLLHTFTTLSLSTHTRAHSHTRTPSTLSRVQAKQEPSSSSTSGEGGEDGLTSVTEGLGELGVGVTTPTLGVGLVDQGEHN